MRPKEFDYYQPALLNEAIRLLHKKRDAKVLAGGQSLISLMKLRLASPAALVDINGLGEDLS